MGRVDLSLVLADTLGHLRVRRTEEALAKGWGAVPDWVFVNEHGRPIWKSDFERRVFHKALEKAGLRRIRFDDLRHTFASRLLQNGESVVYVKDQLGHHSIKSTVDVYGHLVPGANKAAVDRLKEQARACEAARGVNALSTSRSSKKASRASRLSRPKLAITCAEAAWRARPAANSALGSTAILAAPWSWSRAGRRVDLRRQCAEGPESATKRQAEQNEDERERRRLQEATKRYKDL